MAGTWRTSAAWPLAGRTTASLTLGRSQHGDGELLRDDQLPGPQPHTVTVNSPPHIGHEAGHWWGDVAADQASLDKDCVVFDSAELPASVEILGAPELRVWTEPAPGAHLFARLEDVAPDGRVTLVTGAGTRLPGDGASPVEVELPLHWTSWRFPASHRIRIALSTALWPMFWPAIRTGPVIIRLGGLEPSALTLPVPPAEWGTDTAPPPGLPATAPSAGRSGAQPTRPEPVWELDESAEPVRFTWATTGSTQLDFATMTSRNQLEFSAGGSPVIEAAAVGEASMDVLLPGGTLRWTIRTHLRSSGERYHFTFRRLLTRGGAVIRQREWEYGLPRHQ